ncbi:MAG: DUF1152 domain-containing protein, partial [Candidatus Eremiobacterota bacterium]
MSFAAPLSPPEGMPVLVAGCGGGYDVVCGLPVALALRSRGHRVHLASFAFTEVELVPGAHAELPGLYRVDSRCEPPPMGYFPEGFLSKWWERTFEEEQPVWCYRRVGVAPLSEYFAHLRDRLGLGALVVVDGGVDGLFLGNEFDLGTPTTDAISILAAYSTTGLQRYYAFTAFGTEGFDHEVRHFDALERIADLVRTGAMLGVSALLQGQEPGDRFLEAVDYLHARMERCWHSNMAGSVAAAMRGTFGDARFSVKTEACPIWVSPLTLLYWFF